MCKTRIKVIDEYTIGEELEVAVNMFIEDPKNKVIKVNSVKFETYYDEDDDLCMFAVINYELGD
ncbi:hypothetical protein SY212_03330 [Ligilactobacillus agilis]|uniref:RNA-binding protein n=1 Tax=Ligilactobacillus agilis TaxID=1601 RepID=A0A6F9XJ59_9LACO|nr:hypothetical protein [Ligilactobacillus agilis]GET05303.1 hypothetical protein SY212_03330 [Ligilactobacillus agilis]